MKFLNNKKIQQILLAGLVYVPLEPLPGTTPGDAAYGSLSLYLNLVFKILISIGAMVAIITLVLGGITYMVSEIVDKKSEAKRRIQAAILGLLLLLTCWLILYEINPKLTQFSLAGIDQPGSAVPAGFQSGEQPGSFANREAGANTQTPAYGSGDAAANQKTTCENQGRSIHATESGWICI